MSTHSAVVEWLRNGAEFDLGYDRSHRWTFDSGVVVEASSAPELRGDPSKVDPEEAFVASISSCHMLWFLHLASNAGLVVDRYSDDAVGTMEHDATGTTWITKVDLRPTVDWSGDRVPTDAEVDELHHESHRLCFIANSVRTRITVHGS